MTLEDRIKQTKNDLLIGENKSEEILEKVLRYKELNNNLDIYMEPSFKAERGDNDMKANEIQPIKRKKAFTKTFSIAAAIITLILIISVITHVFLSKKEDIKNTADNTETQTQITTDDNFNLQTNKDFYDMTELEQNTIYNQFSAISEKFSLQEFTDTFGKNQSSSNDNDLHYYRFINDDYNTQYNINAAIENDFYSKHLRISFYVEPYNISNEYTEAYNAAMQKIKKGMTFDEVNEIFDDYVLSEVDIINLYYSDGSRQQDITVHYLYFLKNESGCSVIEVHYNMEDQTVTYSSILD